MDNRQSSGNSGATKVSLGSTVEPAQDPLKFSAPAGAANGNDIEKVLLAAICAGLMEISRLSREIESRLITIKDLGTADSTEPGSGPRN